MIQAVGRVRTPENRPVKGIAVSNGEDIVVTDARGCFRMAADPTIHPFLFATPRSCLRDGWYMRTPAEDCEVELIVSPPPRHNSRRTVRLGHVTDLHLTVDGMPGVISSGQLGRDLRWLASEAPDVDVLVATGDLTNRGDAASLRALRRTFHRSPIPVAAMFGGHDGNWERLGRRGEGHPPYTNNWQEIMGPLYYAVALGRWSLLVCPDEDGFLGDAQTGRKRRWLETALALAKGKRIVLAQHSPPSATWLKTLAARGVEVVLYGHWHSSKCHRHAGVLALCGPPLVFGGIDASCRGFRTLELGGGRPRVRWTALQRRRRSKAAGGRSRLDVLWRAAARVPLGRGAIVADDTDVFVPLADEEFRGRAGLLCLSTETGRPRWTSPTEHSVRGVPVAAGDRILVNTQTGGVVCFHRQEGRRLWSRRLAGYPDRWIFTGPCIAEGNVVSGTGGGGLEAFDLRTGRLRWKWKHPRGTSDKWAQYNCPVEVGRCVVAQVTRHGVSCVSAATGRPRWHTRLYYEYLLAPMLPVGGKLFVPDRPSRLRAVNVADGRILWSRRVRGGDIITWGCDEELLVLATEQGDIQARRVGNGQLIWDRTCGRDLADLVPYHRNARTSLAQPLVRPEGVYLAGLDGRLCVADRSTGKRLASLDVGEPVVSMAAAAEGPIFLATLDGRILCIRALGGRSR